MMSAKRGETLDPPRRVEILRVEDQRPSSYFKVGQFGYARSRQMSGGFATQDAGESKAGQAVYAVSKAKDGRGGAVWFTEDGIRFTGRGAARKHQVVEPRRGRPVVKRGVRGIYEVLWYDTGAGEIRSLVNRTVVAKYTPGLGWEDHGRLPDDVREYAQQIASAGAGAVPHHETSGRSETQHKKSHAQIKREVDEILTGKPMSHASVSRDRAAELIAGYGTWKSTYSNEDFDRAQHLAQELTDIDRQEGRTAPSVGYSTGRFRQARQVVKDANLYGEHQQQLRARSPRRS